MALLTVTEPFAVFDSNGFPTVYNPGRLVDDSDPVVKGREAHFESADAAAARARVESATAAPGERRARTRATKKAARKAPAKKAAAKKSAPAPKADTPPPAGETPDADSSTGEKL